MFKRLPDAASAPLVVTIDDVDCEVRAGDSVAAALFASGRRASRTSSVSGAPRGPFCLMGVCFDCLVVIDDVPNQQACMVIVAAGMRIRTQWGAPGVRP